MRSLIATLAICGLVFAADASEIAMANATTDTHAYHVVDLNIRQVDGSQQDSYFKTQMKAVSPSSENPNPDVAVFRVERTEAFVARTTRRDGNILIEPGVKHTVMEGEFTVDNDQAKLHLYMGVSPVADERGFSSFVMDSSHAVSVALTPGKNEAIMTIDGGEYLVSANYQPGDTPSP